MTASRREAIAAKEVRRPTDRTEEIAADLAIKFDRKPSTMLAEVRKARAKRLQAERKD